MVRHHPQWHAVRAHIRAGDIGTLRFMQVPISYFNADAANIRNQAALGGGAHFDIGCYAITAGRIEIEIPFNLETAVGRARVSGDAVRWQGATTLRAPARKEEQRRQRSEALLNRVRSGVTHEVMAGVGRKVCIHAVFPAEESGQLRFLG